MIFKFHQCLHCTAVAIFEGGFRLHSACGLLRPKTGHKLLLNTAIVQTKSMKFYQWS